MNVDYKLCTPQAGVPYQNSIEKNTAMKMRFNKYDVRFIAIVEIAILASFLIEICYFANG